MSIHNDPNRPPAAGVIGLVTLALIACMVGGLTYGVILQYGTQEMVNVATGAIVLLVVGVGYSLRNAMK